MNTTQRLRRPLLLAAAALALAACLTLAAAVTLGGASPDGTGAGVGATLARPAVALTPAAAAGAGALVASLQARLRQTPEDERSWSSLSLAYVEQARVTADPTYYGRADRALARATRLAPDDSVMFTATATLAAARHEFTEALVSAGKALAINPYDAQAEAIRSDALTELGHYPAAAKAAARADDLEPGPSTFARLSYQRELRGDLTGAVALMRRSLESAGASAPSYAFAAFHLGELSRAQGRPAEAAHWYRAALGADPAYLPALAGTARLAVAHGRVAAAEKEYLRVVRGLPLPEYVVELGELYEATGRQDLADQQYAVALATDRLFTANGVAIDLEIAIFQADHGSAAESLRSARAEWSRRHSILSADALGWALHAAGRDREALAYARFATRLGTRDARLAFHRGAIEAALRLPAAARHLRDARALDAGVSPYREQQVATLLRGLR